MNKIKKGIYSKLRNQNIIPCVVYGKHKEDHALLSCDKNEFIKLFKKT
jgi:ribosomal protein L25 (general stress protein Ctc)